jgi:hypothetical protein
MIVPPRLDEMALLRHDTRIRPVTCGLFRAGLSLTASRRAAKLIDFGAPIAVVPGSYLILSHCTHDHPSHHASPSSNQLTLTKFAPVLVENVT